MKTILLSVLILVVPIAGLAEEQANYCLDPETNAEWVQMLSKSPNDDLIAELFALRIGLCELVKREVISLDRATGIFEAARGRGISERKREQLRQQQKEGGGA